ncbi:RNA polymerase II transcription factor-like protein [Aulographum hederae CBS 113979]|uniref:RNA polymerase II transcription factor-like protein n=1 Tax=Aulographum hederae CBS 113979 TaxID=1176131 RepID=A0A6G1HF93_9PEZI|nr:RNA polymerase II transcription factor-like protein [Aulographum hederae CBS 113979]
MAAPALSAEASYKKKDGVLSFSFKDQLIVWTPAVPPNAPPYLTISVADVGNLQQTPPTAAKASIRVVVNRAGGDTESQSFVFTSTTTSRSDQNEFTTAVKNGVEARKSGNTNQATLSGAGSGGAQTPLPELSQGGQSAAMAIAKAVSSGAKPEEAVLDDSRLIADMSLQRSLLDANPVLGQRFRESYQQKPESITASQFATQFWSARVHLLRAHAVKESQKHGSYNVLSEVKTKKDLEGRTTLNISKEQIQLIFTQHPLVRRVYNETVPKPFSEVEFWSNFINSRLCKKLKGEKINPDLVAPQPTLDKYLNYDENAEHTRQFIMSKVPHFMDLEGNEENHSRRAGNRPDWTMRPQAHDKVPILRVLNTMSEKMMVEVAPSDSEAHAPVGLDEDTFNEVRLRDLARDDPDNRVMLNIRDQQRFFSGESNAVSSETALYAKQSPSKVLKRIGQDMHFEAGGKKRKFMDLEEAIGVQEASDDSEEEAEKATKSQRIGSKPARAAATAHIMNSIKQRQSQDNDYSSPTGSFSAVQPSVTGLDPAMTDSIEMSNNTTVEFLQYFWSIFHSGNADRVGELQQLYTTLQKSRERVEAVADGAEKVRLQKEDDHRKRVEDFVKKTGQRRKYVPGTIKGGSKAVNQMAAPLLRAIKAATDAYENALRVQTALLQT